MRPISMVWFRRLLGAATVALALLLAAACGHGSGADSHPPAPPAIHGTVRSYVSASKAHLIPMARVRVAAYRRAFPVVGPIMADGPPPVAITATADDGTFSLRDLPAGRYFVVAADSAQWVTLPPGHGATADFRVCADCPKPM